MKAFAFSALVLVPIALTAQVPRDAAPLKYWPAPLYWQPAHEQNRFPERSELFSANAATPAQTPANSLVFVAITPCRLVDTRTGFGFTGNFGPPSLTGAATRNFPIRASTTCTIPATAQAYSLNLTVVPPGPLTYLTIWPVGSVQPNASALNDTLGGIVANAAIVPAGTDGSGSVSVFVSNNTDLIIDINGYYAPQSGITLTQGTAAAPSLSFSGDAGTGIYSSGAGAVNIATGGTNRLTVRSDGDVDLAGNIRKSGTLFVHNLGGTNSTGTGLGLNALNPSATGDANTAAGWRALFNDTTGNYNTAAGAAALISNTTGSVNTAVGADALQLNTIGANNTAVGGFSLGGNTTGSSNTAVGQAALEFNTTGSQNTAVGQAALLSNTTGGPNTAVGNGALAANLTSTNNVAVGQNVLPVFNSTTGGDGYNTAIGNVSMNSLKSGFSNVAIGHFAMSTATAATYNTGVGYVALRDSTGNGNIGIGAFAGSTLGSGSNNIMIGHSGVATDNFTIRIGNGQGAFFAAGVRGATTGAANAVPVLIDSNGQLGTTSSSRRFKEDIQDMAGGSAGLLQLRPVTYRYKQPYADGSKPLDYGLIAEEVAEVYPDLVVRNADGQVETVQYQKLTPMLLNELQKEHERGSQQQQQIAEQQELNRKLADRLAAVEALLSSLTGK